MIELFWKIKTIFSQHDRHRLVWLVVLMIAAALFEALGIGLILPIVNVVSNPQRLATSELYIMTADILKAGSVNEFVTRASLCLVLYLLIKNAFLTYVSFFQSYFTAQKEAEVSTNLLQTYLSMSYEKFIEKNSADLLRNINQETSQLFTNVVTPFLNTIAELFVVIALVALLILASPGATLIAAACGVVSGVILMVFIKRPLSRLGMQRLEARGRMLEWATHGLYGLKELVVAGRINYFTDAFRSKSVEMAQAQGFSEAMSRIPRLFVETVAVVILLAVIVYMLSTESDLIPVLSLFGLAMIRLLPSVNRIIVGMTRVLFFRPALDAVAADLAVHSFSNVQQATIKHMSFDKNILLDNIVYQYPGADKPVLAGLSMMVEKGSSVSIVGPSGSGKSTLLDLMLGLIEPQSGLIQVDGVPIQQNLDGWRQNLSYLPQFVYLVNGTIRTNVAFGLNDEDVDDDLVRSALAKAEMLDFVDGMPLGLDTQIGDVSSKISGGQRQRIGIARALYHGRKILFLDEATAALDPQTELKICATLKALTPEVTLISVSHRQALVDIADVIYRMENGLLQRQ